MLQVGDAKTFPKVFYFKSLDSFLRVSKQSPSFTAIEEDGYDKKLVQLELAGDADGVVSLVSI